MTSVIARADPINGRVWHPWLRVSRLITGLRSTRWDAATCRRRRRRCSPRWKNAAGCNALAGST